MSESGRASTSSIVCSRCFLRYPIPRLAIEICGDSVTQSWLSVNIKVHKELFNGSTMPTMNAVELAGSSIARVNIILYGRSLTDINT